MITNARQVLQAILKIPIRLQGRDGRVIPEYWSIGVLVMKKAVVLSFFSSTPLLPLFEACGQDYQALNVFLR